MPQKNLIIFLFVVVLILAGAAMYLITSPCSITNTSTFIRKESKATQAANPSSQTQEKNIAWQMFKSDKYGYEFQYPSTAQLTDSDTQVLVAFDLGKSPYGLEMGHGVSGMSVDVSESAMDLAAVEKGLKQEGQFKNCRILQLEKGDSQNPTKAIRCDYPGVPKQEPPAYSYFLVNGKYEYQISFSYNDTVVTDAIGTKIHDLYDPIGDNIMINTFSLVK